MTARFGDEFLDPGLVVRHPRHVWLVVDRHFRVSLGDIDPYEHGLAVGHPDFPRWRTRDRPVPVLRDAGSKVLATIRDLAIAPAMRRPK